MRARSLLGSKTFLLFAAFLSTIGVSGMVKTDASLFSISNSVWSLIIFLSIYFFFSWLSLRTCGPREMVISGVLGLFFSLFMVIGVNSLKTNSTLLNHLGTWVYFVFGYPFWFGVVLATLTVVLPNLNRFELGTKVGEAIDSLFGLRRAFIVIWLIIFIAWLPSLIASFPGVYAYDTVYQVGYYLTGKFDLHHPLIDSYFVGFCVVTLGRVFHSREIGMCIYSISQMLILSASFSYILIYMRDRKVSRLIRLFFLLIFMFLPINPIMGFSATKDIVYSAFFVVVLIMIIKVVHNPSLMGKTGFMISFWCVSFLNMAFRSQGVYVFVFMTLFAMVYFRRRLLKAALMFIVPLLMFAVYSGPVTTALGGVRTENLQEAMSVPVVQLSRALYTDDGEISSEQASQIRSYIPNYKTIHGNDGISDSMKNTFNVPKFKRNPIQFIKLWATVGIKKPMSYIDAFTRLSIGLWYPDMNYSDPEAFHVYWEYKSSVGDQFYLVGRHTPRSMKWLANIYYRLTYSNSYQRVPIVSLMFSSGAYVWIMLLSIAEMILKKRNGLIVAFSFPFALWLTLLLGPMVWFRYVFPLTMCVPVFVTESIVSEEDENSTGRNK